MSNDSLIEKLSKLATHLHSLDSGSGEAALLFEAIEALQRNHLASPEVELRKANAIADVWKKCAYDLAGNPSESEVKATLQAMGESARAPLCTDDSLPSSRNLGRNQADANRDSPASPSEVSSLITGLDTMAMTFAQWIERNSDKGDDQHVITPPVWPTIGVLKAWVVTLVRAQRLLSEPVSISLEKCVQAIDGIATDEGFVIAVLESLKQQGVRFVYGD